MRALRLLLLWFATVALFALFGWCSADPWYGYTNDGPFYKNLRFEPAVAFTATGVGAASCIVAGLVVIGGVRSRRLRRSWALVLLIVSSVLATISPLFLLGVAQASTRWRAPIEEHLNDVHLFQGDYVWIAVGAFYTAVWIALVAFIVFAVCVFRVKRYDVA